MATSLSRSRQSTESASAGNVGHWSLVEASAELVLEALKPSTSVHRLLSAAASVNATSVKASAGAVIKVVGYNAAASARYLKFYDLAAAPTVGTSTPLWTEYIPATSKFTIDFPKSLAFSTGIAYGLTTGAADNDTAALTAGDILALNLLYI